jgi:hypothetical protein
MSVSEIKFISTIGTLWKDRMIINIPKFHEQAREIRDKQVIVIIKEALID